MWEWSILAIVYTASMGVRLVEVVQRRRAQVGIDRKLACVLDVLLVWAQTWGQEPERVSGFLHRTLTMHGFGQRAEEDVRLGSVERRGQDDRRRHH